MRTENLQLPNGFTNRTYYKIEVEMPHTTPEEQAMYDLTNATVIMQVRVKPTTPVLMEFTTDTSSIPLEQGKVEYHIIEKDPNNVYKITIPQFFCKLPANEYVYDILFIYSNVKERSYIAGSWIVEETVTDKNA